MRVLSVVLGLVLALAAAVAGVSWLGYHTPDSPRALAVKGLRAEAAFRFSDDPAQPSAVEVASVADLWPALGYAQAHDHLAVLALWRQAARGEMARWLGPEAIRLDRHAQRLAFLDGATQAYPRLGPDERAMVDGFADGVNAALTTRRAALDPTLALYRVRPEPWTGADVLAIERLAAWIAAAPPLDSVDLKDPSLARFAENDRLLRDLLCADAFSDSRVFAYRLASDSTAPAGGWHLTAQFQTGSSAWPTFPTIRLRVGVREGVATFLPGTPFPLAGRLGTSRWAVRPTGTSEIRAQPDDTGRDRRETLLANNGVVEDLVVTTSDTVLHLGPAPAVRAAPGDSAQATVDSTGTPVWGLAWRGLRPRTDAALWHGLWTGRPATSQLFAPALVWIDGSRMLTFGPALRDSAQAVMLAPADAAPYLLARLSDDNARTGRPEDDVFSLWAARQAAPLVPQLVQARLTSRQEREAYQYLRNWTYGYTSGDIAPTLFDAWLAEIDRREGRRGDAVLADTGHFAGYRLTEAFRAAVAHVARTHGADPRGWRWAEARPASRHYPIASVTGRLRLPQPAPSHFATLLLPGASHPTTLRFQPGDPTGRATAPIELRLAARPDDDALQMLPPPSGVLANSRAQDRPALLRLHTPLPHTTRLLLFP